MRRSGSLGFVLLLGLSSAGTLGVRSTVAWAQVQSGVQGQGGARAKSNAPGSGVHVAAAGLGSRGVAAEPGSLEAGKTSEAVLEARRRWDEGLKAAELGNYELAVAAFRQSYAVVPHVETLRNLALAELEVGDFVQAATHLSQYLAGSTDLTPQERQGLERELASTERMVARLDLEVSPEDAVLLIDGVRIEPPLTGRPWYLSPGRHSVHASLGDSAPVEREVELGAGRYQSLRFDLERPKSGGGGASGAAVAPREPDDGAHVPDTSRSRMGHDDEVWPEGKRWAVVGGGVLTAVSLGVAAYGEATLPSRSSDVDAARVELEDASTETYPCVAPTGSIAGICRDLREAEERQQRAETLSNVGFIMAGALGAATVATWLLWPNEASQARTGMGSGSAVLVTPWATAQGAGWAVLGQF